jgi:hypothetical protein
MTSPFGGTHVPAQYEAQVLASAAKWGISPALLAAQLDAESGFNPNSVSSAGAVGIAQFLPSTAREWGVNPYDVNSAIDGMAHLDSVYYKRYGSISKALAAYNAGPGAVEKYGDVPPYAQTQNYVRKILIAAGSALSANGENIPSNDLQLELVSSGDSAPGLTHLAGQLLKPEWWKRVGIASAGLLVVLLGLYFMMKKSPGSFKPLREIGSEIKNGT